MPFKVINYSRYTPRKLCGGYTVFTLSVRASVRNILVFFYLEESLLDFHQTLQTCSYMQDNTLDKKLRARGNLRS